MSDDPADFPMVMGRYGPRYAYSWEVEDMERRQAEDLIGRCSEIATEGEVGLYLDPEHNYLTWDGSDLREFGGDIIAASLDFGERAGLS